MKKIKKKFKLKNRKGAALMWVIAIFIIVIALSMVMLGLTNQNTIEMRRQEEAARSHYVALSGVELVYAALNQDNGKGGIYMDNALGGSFVRDTVEIPIKDDNGKDVGTAKVKINTVTKSGDKWLKLESKGTLKNSPTNVRSIMRINAKNYNVIIRENQYKED